ncbi:MAG: TetR family transcriptional regulator, partial [Polaribacter sp.]
KNVGNSSTYQLKKYYPKIYHNVVLSGIEKSKNAIKSNIEKGITEGIFRKDIDIDICADFYFSLSLSIHEKDIPQNEVLKQKKELLIYHTRAIATEKGIKELETELDKHK